ncbi:MAG: hypothetical protein IPQ17_14575 [Xanthomonadales bacterium]|nr:hypothetical protein [Xanthomonadales bacterium]
MGLIIAGILLIAVGAAAFTGNLNFTKDKQVLKIGELSASVQQERACRSGSAASVPWSVSAWLPPVPCARADPQHGARSVRSLHAIAPCLPAPRHQVIWRDGCFPPAG